MSGFEALEVDTLVAKFIRNVIIFICQVIAMVMVALTCNTVCLVCFHSLGSWGSINVMHVTSHGYHQGFGNHTYGPNLVLVLGGVVGNVVFC